MAATIIITLSECTLLGSSAANTLTTSSGLGFVTTLSYTTPEASESLSASILLCFFSRSKVSDISSMIAAFCSSSSTGSASTSSNRSSTM